MANEPTSAESELNINQRLFCQYYAGGGEWFGNGVWSYVFAFELKVPFREYKCMSEEQKADYDSACVMASALLRNVKIKNYINKLLDELIKDEIVDRELAKVVMQDKELGPKVQAVREYNRVKGRGLDRVEHSMDDNLIDILNRAMKNDGKQKENSNTDKG
jgi:hypothetical protein